MLNSNHSRAVLAVLLFAFMLLSLPSPGFSQELVGAPKCKGCHKAKTGDQWKIWTESAHARAFETLASEQAAGIAAELGIGDPQQEPACLKCHTTRASLGETVPLSESGSYADSEGVGCEACHGPGSEYKAKQVMTDPQAARAAGMLMRKTAEACGACHNPESPTFVDFDFDLRWAQIAHPVPGDEAVPSGATPAVAGMPGEIIIESSVGDVHFPHNLHVTDLGVGCGECHHQINAKVLDTPHAEYLTSSWINCQICHGTDSTDRQKYYQCSHCHHSDVENIADETLSAKVVVHKSCWNCHESGTGIEASKGCSECHVKAAN